MRVIFLLAVSLIGLLFSVAAQTKQGFYDVRRRESDGNHARYYYVVEHKDSLWLKKVYYVPEKKLYMFGTYLDSNCKREHGKFYYMYPSGQMENSGEFNDHKKEGIWIGFHSNGAMRDSCVWKNGKRSGTALSWYENGFIMDSAIYNEDESGILITWFDNGTPASGGNYAAGRKMTGKWRFFHYNGKLSAEEYYESGKLVSKNYFDPSGRLVTDTSDRDRKALFASKESFSDFLLRSINARVPANHRAPPGVYVVTIRLVVDLDGKVSGIFPLSKEGFGMEEEAMRVIKKSIWLPAIEHGRRVKAYMTQPVSFMIRAY